MEQDKYLKRLRDTHAMMLGRYTLSNVARLMDSWIPDSNPYMEALCRAAHSDPVLVLDMLQPVIEINSLEWTPNTTVDKLNFLRRTALNFDAIMVDNAESDAIIKE